MPKPKCLVIAPFSFFPPDAGGKLVINNNLGALSQHFEVHIALPRPWEPAQIEGLRQLQAEFTVYPINVLWVPATVSIWTRIMRFLDNAFNILILNKIADFERDFYQDPAVKRLISDDFAFIQVEHSFFYHPELRKRNGALVINMHNFEKEYYWQCAVSHLMRGHIIRSIAHFVRMVQVQRLEKLALEDADLILSLTARDANLAQKHLGLKKTIVELGTGLDLNNFPRMERAATEAGQEAVLCFVGSMDNPQNEDAAVFFIEKIMPHLAAADKNFHFIIAGRSPSASLKKIARNAPVKTTVTGSVPDTRVPLSKSDIFVNPIRF